MARYGRRDEAGGSVSRLGIPVADVVVVHVPLADRHRLILDGTLRRRRCSISTPRPHHPGSYKTLLASSAQESYVQDCGAGVEVS